MNNKMSKIIFVDRYTSRKQLDEQLIKIPKRKIAMDLDKYFGKINFGVDGLEYQLKIRSEWE